MNILIYFFIKNVILLFLKILFYLIASKTSYNYWIILLLVISYHYVKITILNSCHLKMTTKLMSKYQTPINLISLQLLS